MKNALSRQSTATDLTGRGPGETHGPQSTLVTLQRHLGNLSLQGILQAKLHISQPDDPLESEADNIAGLAKGSVSNGISHPQGPPDNSPPVPGGAAHASTSSAASGGAPLSSELRNRIEPMLGTDLGDVRVHANARAGEAASSLNAKAFTLKNHIYLGANQSRNDLELLAHEATHTVQQRGGNLDAVRLGAKRVSPLTQTNAHPVLQRWGEELGEESPVCQSRESYGESSYHVPPEAGDYQIPSEVTLYLEVPLPLTEAQLRDPNQARSVRYLLNEPVEQATTSVFYAVLRQHVYANPDEIPEAVCRAPLAVDEILSEQAAITGPHLPASIPLPPSAYTMDAVIDIIAETPDVVITTTYTKMAVGAGSTTVLRTHSDYMLIDAGINSIGGDYSADLARETLSRLVEINPTGHFREIIFSHGHGDHITIASQVAREFSIGALRTNALQLLLETQTGARPFRDMLREVYTNQETLIEGRQREQARAQAEEEARGMPLEPDEGLRRARIESLTERAYEALRASRQPVALEALVPSETGLGVVRTVAPATTLPEALEIGGVQPGNAYVEAPSEGVRRATFSDPEMRPQLETGELPSNRADRYSSSYIIELPHGNQLIVIPDIRTVDIVRQIQAMETAMARLGQPMRFRIWDATHHMQSGFVVNGTSFARMVQLLTRLTGVETRAGGPSAEAIAVSVRDAAITGELSRSLVDPALAFLMRSLGYEVFLTMGGQDIRVIEAMLGEQRISGVVGDPYAGRAPTDMLVRRAGSALTYLQERIDSGTGDRAALRAHQRTVRDALSGYYEGVSSEIGRSDVGGTSGRPEVAPARAQPGAAAPARVAGAQAQALIDALQPVEAMDGYAFRPVGRIPVLNEYALIILNLEDLARLSDNGREFLRNRQRLLAMEETMPRGAEVGYESVTDYLQLLRVQRQLLRAVINETDVPANRTAMEVELSSLEARIASTESAAGLVTEGSRITMPGGRTLEAEVTTNEAVPIQAQWGRVNRGAAWVLERSARPMGGIMVAFTLRAQQELGQRIEDNEIPPLQALIGTTHNAYGVQIGMRMMSGIRISPYEFVVLAVMDVAQTMAGEYGTEEMWWTQFSGSMIRNSVQLALLFFAERIGTRHPAAALIALGLMFVVDPLLQYSGFYDWLERVFAFAPSDITYVDQHLRNDLLPEYRTVVGALQLAQRSPQSLSAAGISGSLDTQAAVRTHRERARQLDDDIMEYFAEAYSEAATSYVGLRELDIMRAEYLRLRHMAHEGTVDTNRESILERFGRITESLSLEHYTPEQVRDMDQWGEINDALSTLNWEIAETGYDEIDWDDVLQAQERMDMMLRNARYRLNPGASAGPVLRSAALITPSSPGYRTYISLLDDAELRYRRVLEMVRTRETRVAEVAVPFNTVHAAQMLDEFANVMAGMEAIPEESSANRSPEGYQYYIQSHASVLRNLRRLQVLERGAANAQARLRFDRMSGAQTTESEVRNLLEQERRLRELVQQRRELHGFIYESELPGYQSPTRLEEDRRLLQALSPRETVIRPFTLEEMTALTSSELEGEAGRATTVANQIALWRQRTRGSSPQIFLLHDPAGESIIGGVNASAGAIVGFVRRSSDEMISMRGHYRLVSVIPLNRAAVDAVGRTLQAPGFLGRTQEKWVHPDVLLQVPLEELDTVLLDPASHRQNLAGVPPT